MGQSTMAAQGKATHCQASKMVVSCELRSRCSKQRAPQIALVRDRQLRNAAARLRCSMRRSSSLADRSMCACCRMAANADHSTCTAIHTLYQ